MFRRNTAKSHQRLILSVMLCLSSCAADNSELCPVFPLAGSKVATELEQAEYEKFKNTWEWIGRLEKLKRQLDLCRS